MNFDTIEKYLKFLSRFTEELECSLNPLKKLYSNEQLDKIAIELRVEFDSNFNRQLDESDKQKIDFLANAYKNRYASPMLSSKYLMISSQISTHDTFRNVKLRMATREFQLLKKYNKQNMLNWSKKEVETRATNYMHENIGIWIIPDEQTKDDFKLTLALAGLREEIITH